MRWQSQGLRYHNATIRMIWCPVDAALTRNQTEGHDQEFPTRVHSVSSEFSFPNHVSETCKLMLKMFNAGILPKAVKPCQQRQEPRACRTAQPRSPSRNGHVAQAQAPSTFLSSPFDWVLSAGRASQKCPESKLRRKISWLMGNFDFVMQSPDVLEISIQAARTPGTSTHAAPQGSSG